jgi:hypothetical protein
MQQRPRRLRLRSHRLTGRNPQLSITALSMNRDRPSLSVSWLLSGPFPAQPRH